MRVLRSNRPSSCSMLDASTVFRCARVCSTYWSDATHPHTLDATPLSRHATLPQVPRYGVHERSEHGGLERVQRTFRTGCVRCSCQLSTQPTPPVHACSTLTMPPAHRRQLRPTGAERPGLTKQKQDRRHLARRRIAARERQLTAGGGRPPPTGRAPPPPPAPPPAASPRRAAATRTTATCAPTRSSRRTRSR